MWSLRVARLYAFRRFHNLLLVYKFVGVCLFVHVQTTPPGIYVCSSAAPLIGGRRSPSNTLGEAGRAAGLTPLDGAALRSATGDQRRPRRSARWRQVLGEQVYTSPLCHQRATKSAAKASMPISASRPGSRSPVWAAE